MRSLKTASQTFADHFTDVRNMVECGSGGMNIFLSIVVTVNNTSANMDVDGIDTLRK
ncbi:MAG: hypothetical protein AB7V36_02410 [Bacteroidales bacterium]